MVEAFALDIVIRAQDAGFDLSGMTASHVCFRAETEEEYVRVRDGLAAVRSEFCEYEFNGRRISLHVLREPARASVLSIPMIELPAPRAAHEYPSGLEHLGLVVPGDFAAFAARYEKKFHGQKDRGPHCQPRFFTFADGKTIKFYERPLREVVELAGRRFTRS